MVKNLFHDKADLTFTIKGFSTIFPFSLSDRFQLKNEIDNQLADRHQKGKNPQKINWQAALRAAHVLSFTKSTLAKLSSSALIIHDAARWAWLGTWILSSLSAAYITGRML